MAKTVVGLFEDPKSVDAIVRDLDADGFSRSNVRVIAEPADLGGSGLMSIAHSDFEVGLLQELRTIGAVEADAEAYVKGVRRGGVMVFATGSGGRVKSAAAIMNRHNAVEIETLKVPEPRLPGMEGADKTPRRDDSIQTGRTRSSGDGARLFVW